MMAERNKPAPDTVVSTPDVPPPAPSTGSAPITTEPPKAAKKRPWPPKEDCCRGKNTHRVEKTPGPPKDGRRHRKGTGESRKNICPGEKTPAAAEDAAVDKSEGNDVLVARKGPAITVETLGPRRISVGKESTYQVSITNSGEAAGEELVVFVSLPPWAEVLGAEATSGAAQVSATGPGAWNRAMEARPPRRQGARATGAEDYSPPEPPLRSGRALGVPGGRPRKPRSRSRSRNSSCNSTGRGKCCTERKKSTGSSSPTWAMATRKTFPSC